MFSEIKLEKFDDMSFKEKLKLCKTKEINYEFGNEALFLQPCGRPPTDNQIIHERVVQIIEINSTKLTDFKKPGRVKPPETPISLNLQTVSELHVIFFAYLVQFPFSILWKEKSPPRTTEKLCENKALKSTSSIAQLLIYPDYSNNFVLLSTTAHANIELV